MKIVETNDLSDIQSDSQSNIRGRMLNASDTFEFRCHPGVSCFNLCCRNLNFFLNPYDVIRLKQNLGISSSEFIEQYTDIIMRPGHHFPDVLLRMADNEEKTCPFLTADGCRVYSDRPHTCRAFPVEHGLYYDAAKNHTRLVHFFRPPDFCQGRHEKTVWTLSSWEADQEAAFFNQMTVRWAEVARLFQNDPFEGQGPNGQKGKMAFMAVYNIDAFRDFVLTSSFLKRYKVKSQLRMKLKSDDVAVLKLGMAWIKMFLFGLKVGEITLKK
jgi:Fe-S-cluster containining protein